jgi:hypothetical protein
LEILARPDGLRKGAVVAGDLIHLDVAIVLTALITVVFRAATAFFLFSIIATIFTTPFATIVTCIGIKPRRVIIRAIGIRIWRIWCPRPVSTVVAILPAGSQRLKANNVGRILGAILGASAH